MYVCRSKYRWFDSRGWLSDSESGCVCLLVVFLLRADYGNKIIVGIWKMERGYSGCELSCTASGFRGNLWVCTRSERKLCLCVFVYCKRWGSCGFYSVLLPFSSSELRRVICLCLQLHFSKWFSFLVPMNLRRIVSLFAFSYAFSLVFILYSPLPQNSLFLHFRHPPLLLLLLFVSIAPLATQLPFTYGTSALGRASANRAGDEGNKREGLPEQKKKRSVAEWRAKDSLEMPWCQMRRAEGRFKGIARCHTCFRRSLPRVGWCFTMYLTQTDTSVIAALTSIMSECRDRIQMFYWSQCNANVKLVNFQVRVLHLPFTWLQRNQRIAQCVHEL